MGQIARVKATKMTPADAAALMTPDELREALRIQHEEARRIRDEADQRMKATLGINVGRPKSPRCACGRHTVAAAEKKGLPCRIDVISKKRK